jgi:hypothetical protein
MGFIGFHIENQNLVWDFLHDESVCSSKGVLRVVHYLLQMKPKITPVARPQSNYSKISRAKHIIPELTANCPEIMARLNVVFKNFITNFLNTDATTVRRSLTCSSLP